MDFMRTAPHLAPISSEGVSAHVGSGGGAVSISTAPPDLLAKDRARELAQIRREETAERKVLIREIEIKNTEALVDQIIANAKARRIRVGQHRAWSDRVEQRAIEMRKRHAC